MGKPTKRDEMSLQPRISLEPFDEWSLDFVGPIDPPSYQKRHILRCIFYFTKLVEVKAMKIATDDKVAQFLQENIFS